MNNQYAWRLGEAARAAKPGGDLIDLGWSLARELHNRGFDLVPRDRGPAGLNRATTIAEMCNFPTLSLNQWGNEMATITKHTCDICKEPAKKLQQRMPVVFLTEQTEGRSCKPHLTLETLDLCEKCLQRIVDSYPLTAYGAQGSNTYEWRS